jgi:hypothetical protein
MEPPPPPAKPSVVYLVEEWWYEVYHLLGVYDNEAAAIAHVEHPAFIKKYGKHISIREVGVRSRTQFKKVHEKGIR